MKQLIVNLVAFFVIGMGSLSLMQAQPAHAQSNVLQPQQVKEQSSCTEGDITVEGDDCYVNDAGHCECRS